MNFDITCSRYGDIDLTRQQIKDRECSSIDHRVVTGAPPGTPDETRVVAPGVFILSVFAQRPEALPVGEIRIIYLGREVSVVGHLTGRPGVIEITPDHLEAASNDTAYAEQLRAWLRSR